jgi:hypothetical protein
MRDKMRTALEFIKFLLTDKSARGDFAVFILLSAAWLCLMFISFSVLDIFIQPLGFYMGYRIVMYGWFAFLPGGKWLSDHFYCKIKYRFKSWYKYFQFIKENTFTLDYEYISKEMIKGDPSSRRETTGIGAVTFGFGRSKYIFNLE